VCTDPRRIIACDTANLASLPKADGLIILDSHLGDALATLTYTDPAVIYPANPGLRFKALDMFDPANGYKAATNSADYYVGFKQNYLNGQAARADALLQDALARWQQIKAANGNLLPDDMPFPVIGANAARLWQPDLKLLRQSKTPHLLLKGDGTRSTEILQSLRFRQARRRMRCRMRAERCRSRYASTSARMRCALSVRTTCTRTISPASISNLPTLAP